MLVRDDVVEPDVVGRRVAVERDVVGVEHHVARVGEVVVGEHIGAGAAVDRLRCDADVPADADLTVGADEIGAVVVGFEHVGDAGQLAPDVERVVEALLPDGGVWERRVEHREQLAGSGRRADCPRNGRAVGDKAVGDDGRVALVEAAAVARGVRPAVPGVEVAASLHDGVPQGHRRGLCGAEPARVRLLGLRSPLRRQPEQHLLVQRRQERVVGGVDGPQHVARSPCIDRGRDARSREQEVGADLGLGSRGQAEEHGRGRNEETLHGVLLGLDGACCRGRVQIVTAAVA